MNNHQSFASSSSSRGNAANHGQQAANSPVNLNLNAQPHQFVNHHSSADQQRQMALLSLFSSLSSLAGNRYQQPPSSNQPIAQNVQQQQQLQSVMAAAMMQHHQQQQQQSKPIVVSTSQASLSSADSPFQKSGQLLDQKEQSQQASLVNQQRINYCTICNKELCNKYFMKTHMLKMHGINLEMETSQNPNSPPAPPNQDNNNNSGEEEEDGKPPRNHRDQPEDCSSSSASGQANNGANWRKRRESPAGQQIRNHSQQPTAAGKQQQQQPTSVMNGFAGNSMGGVICDICNKELCSKYFLKVHKQNTHGIATDNYHEASPFAAILPFALPPNLCAPLGPFQSVAPPLPVGLFGEPAAATAAAVAAAAAAAQDSALAQEKLRSKRMKLGQHQNNIEQAAQKSQKPDDSPSAGQFESLYRLMLAQQQQQSGSDLLAAAAMNPLSALMCFGGANQTAAGPFNLMSPAAASLSPAMIVDQILRNQHLLNQQQQQQNKPNANKMPDRNNNGGTSAPGATKGAAKGGGAGKDAAANKRYFSHYTEACPMCDRRFKSIKWLKTHMMNDHKHEIGAYMQSMVQYLYQTSNSQQQQQHHHQQQQQHQQFVAAAAAASMASSVFSEQPTIFQQQFSSPSQAHQPQHLMSSAAFSQQQPRQFDHVVPPFVDHTAQQQQQQRQQQQHYQEANEDNGFVFDARCTNNNRRQASLSPADQSSYLNQQPRIKRESPLDSPLLLSLSHARHHHITAPSSLIPNEAAEVQDLSGADTVAASAATAVGLATTGLAPSRELSFGLNDDEDEDDEGDTFLSSPNDSPGPTLALDSHLKEQRATHEAADRASSPAKN